MASSGKGNRKLLLVLVSVAFVLVAALAVIIILMMSVSGKNVPATSTSKTDALAESYKAISGVSVNGIDISGMSKDKAMSSTSKISDEVLGKVQVSINVNGQDYKYSASELGLTTDYNDVIDQALLFGNYGSSEERSKAVETAKNGGKDFTVHPKADKAKIEQAVQDLKSKADKQAADATAVFMPWGYTKDGNEYKQDENEMIEAAASGKMWDRPDLVTVDSLPNRLRYKYWKNSKYINGYIPKDARISRFQFKKEQEGQVINADALVQSIMSEVQKGGSVTVTAQVDTTQPTVKLADVKKQTQLISSWTSSYSNHYNYDRNWNVAKLSGIVNGVTIKAGQVWSINKEAGNRTVSGGWRKAAGIENGGYTMQAGGGVCQISSTTYNAAIRSALVIKESSHHSIKSNYIPIGLDATISSGSPDLKIQNPYNTPVYIVSYVNPKDKNVTVEIYGPTVTDSQNGDVILDFTSKSLGTYGNPKMKIYYNVKVCPMDNEPIDPGEAYVYAEARKGEEVQTYKITRSLDGKTLKTENFTHYKWRPINGSTYVNGKTIAPSPSPSKSNSPSPSPSKSTPTPTKSTPTPSTPSPAASTSTKS